MASTASWRWLGIGALLLLLPLPSAAASPPKIRASAAALIDAETGVVLFEKSMHERRPMASTTKVMTALLVLESSDLPETVKVGRVVNTVSGSSLYLKPGDVVRTDDLLTALLVQSANDAAVVLAEEISGSVAAFADRMNERAQQLGVSDTHFLNPHGLHHSGHYSSAYDLAVITREAFNHTRFGELVASKRVKVAVPSAPGGRRLLVNHNKLLWKADYADGVKTGYVRQSGHCLIASGTQDERRLIVVLLNTGDMYGEAKALLDYGFRNFRRQVYVHPGDAVGRAEVRGGQEPQVPVVCQKTLSSISGPGMEDDVRLEVTVAPLEAPVAAGTPAGEARLVSDGRVLASSLLLSSEPVPRSRLRVSGLWLLRAVVIVGLLLLLTRAYGKAVKANRRRGSHLAA
jgi:D-alanyl-D-alanine carboxypeptidase (penicillin-binding protein 5/6)